MHPNKEFMLKAIALAKRKKSDVGCVIVKEGKIIAQAVTSVYGKKDPTAHAEILAIRQAGKKLGSYRLEECYIYSTFEPCPMCAAAAVWARAKGIVFGAALEDETRKCPQRIKIPCAEVLEKGRPKVELHSNFLREECKKLLL